MRTPYEDAEMSDTGLAATDQPKPKNSVPSPCIGVCDMVESIDQCAGCARTSEEIANWRDGPDAWRQAVWKELPTRLKALGVTVQRLQMTQTDILDFIDDSIRGARGTWVLGVYGGVGEFNRDLEEPFSIDRGDNEITAVTSRAALRFSVTRAARLLAIGDKNSGSIPRAYCLAIHKSQVSVPAVSELTNLGPDEEAIRPGDRDASLFDFGLGRDKARFCVRTKDPEMLVALHEAEGQDVGSMLSIAGATILAKSPTRVIETGMGRVEVETAIPAPDERSPTGPHTHLLPGHLAQGIDNAPGLAIPDAYAIGALFYPKRDDVEEAV